MALRYRASYDLWDTFWLRKDPAGFGPPKLYISEC